MENKFGFTTAKTLANVLIYFFLFLAGELVSSILFDLLFSVITLPGSEQYVILRMLGSLCLTIFLFWLYTTKVLHLNMKDFGITCHIKKWAVILAVFLPGFVVVCYALLGNVSCNPVPFHRAAFMVLASLLIALKSGITEEMLFRGYIMRLLESRWNPCIAILVPSFLFGLAHIPSMETFSASGIVLLIISGTLVGVMFSLAAYHGNSVSNSTILHAVWNFVMITDILHITTAQGAYGEPVFSILISSENPLLTGAGFGAEASMISIIGYALVCIAVGWMWKHKVEG